MTEPPAKRVKRTDSSTMWERNNSRTTDVDPISRSTNDSHRAPERSGDRDRRPSRDRKGDRNSLSGHSGREREDRRPRSRSRDRERERGRVGKRRERSRSREIRIERRRSRSRERDGDRYRKGERGDERNGRDRRSTSRGHRSRRDDAHLSRRSDRRRSRSRSYSPGRAKHPSIRNRSPPQNQHEKATTLVQGSKPLSRASPPSSRPENSSSHHPSKTPSLSKDPPDSKASQSAAVNGIPTEPLATTASSSATKMDVDEDPEMTLMRKTMGFCNFRSTKNTKVPGNNVSAVRKDKKTEYRQYMNRIGGFNRPLSPTR